jgi:hypothetical protein
LTKMKNYQKYATVPLETMSANLIASTSDYIDAHKH